jgi:hypothetical protein
MTADIFALRLRLKGRRPLVGYQIRPNVDIPRDKNIIAFPIDPRYVKQGTLDGRRGLKADPTYAKTTSQGQD